MSTNSCKTQNLKCVSDLKKKKKTGLFILIRFSCTKRNNKFAKKGKRKKKKFMIFQSGVFDCARARVLPCFFLSIHQLYVLCKTQEIPPLFFFQCVFKFFLSITRNILPRQMLDFFKYDITMCALCVILNAAPRFFSPFVIIFFFVCQNPGIT